MPRKVKEGNIDFFYMNNINGADKKNAPTKSKKKAKKVNQNSKKKKDDVFNFDDEIVIGISNKKPQTKKNVNVNTKPKTKKRKKKKTLALFLLKWTSIFLLLIGTVIFILTTPMFNIKQINVNGIEQLTEEEVLSLSGLTINENIFKNSKSNIIKNIKQNAYVENVVIKRKLPDNLDITIEERQRSYILQFVNGYVYINNQGYILEISEDKIDLPIIIGYKTEEDKIISGSRLINDDLENLNNVLKITESLEGIEVQTNKITSIDISNKEDYTVYIEEEKKIIHFGDTSNLSSKILYVKSMIDQEKGIEGEIFVNGDINNKFKPFFREKV